jgi:uncharacterized membrane protein
MPDPPLPLSQIRGQFKNRKFATIRFHAGAQTGELDPQAVNDHNVTAMAQTTILMSQEREIAGKPDPSLVTVTHLVYALHALSLLIGLLTAATIIGAFVFGVPSIIAVVVNYLKRGEAQGTFLESHFRWQIRTFWFALLWFVIGALLFATFIGIPFALGVWLAIGLWAIYRIARGWLALRDGKAMYA